jgi:hypothetical protein
MGMEPPSRLRLNRISYLSVYNAMQHLVNRFLYRLVKIYEAVLNGTERLRR